MKKLLLLLLLVQPCEASIIVLFNQDVNPPAISLVSPQSGVYFVGTTMPITWNSDSLTDTITIEISLDGGTTYDQTAVAGTANDGSYDWPVTAPSSSNAKVQVRGTANSTIKSSSSGVVNIVGAYRK